jgi:hypothetical protein
MHRLKASLIFLVSSLLIFACASTTQKHKMPPFKFEGITLAKEIDKSGDIGIPEEQRPQQSQHPQRLCIFGFLFQRSCRKSR